MGRAGFLTERLGYNGYFLVLAGVAAGVFLRMMPETRGERGAREAIEPGIAR
jgi:hypothetical protein